MGNWWEAGLVGRGSFPRIEDWECLWSSFTDPSSNVVTPQFPLAPGRGHPMCSTRRTGIRLKEGLLKG